MVLEVHRKKIQKGALALGLLALLLLLWALIRSCGTQVPLDEGDAGSTDVVVSDVLSTDVTADVSVAPDVKKVVKKKRRKKKKKKAVASKIAKTDVYVRSTDSKLLGKLFKKRVLSRRKNLRFVNTKPARGRMVTLTAKAKKSTRGDTLRFSVKCKMSLSKIPGGLIASTKASAQLEMEGGEASDLPALQRKALPACAKELANDFLGQVH